MRFRRRSVVIGALLTLMLAACSSATQDSSNTESGGEQPTSAPTGESPAAVDQSSAGTVVDDSDPLASQTPADSLTTVRYGSVGGMTDGPLYVADELNYFAAQGIKVEFNRFSSGTEMLAALVTGALDVAAIAAGPGLFNAIDQGHGLKLVADRQSQQGPNRFGQGFLVSKDLASRMDLSDPDSIGAALKGKKIATSGKTVTGQLVLTKLMATYGLGPDDVEWVVLPLSQVPTALATGAIDGGIGLEPYRQKILRDGTAVQISHFDGVISSGTLVPVTYTAAFSENRALAEGFMVAYVQGAMEMTDGLAGSKEHHNQIVNIIAEHAKLDPEAVENADPPGVDITKPVDISFLLEAQDFFIAQGVMEKEVDIASAVDDSFAAAAREKLGIE